MKNLTEEEITQLMRSDEYQNKYNPKFEETQKKVSKAWENLYPEKENGEGFNDFEDMKKNPENYYIWNAVVDDRTRSSHAERDGQVFCWDYPPEGGHPGEDYNCRCTAEPYVPTENDEMCITNDDFEKEMNKKLKIEKVKNFIHNDLRTSHIQATGAIYDFGKNVSDLKWSNKEKKSDKFFHCNANCEATKRGKVGENTAELLSYAKEEFDQKFKRFPKEDSEKDHIANRYGRSQAKRYPKVKCINLCEDVDSFFIKDKKR